MGDCKALSSSLLPPLWASLTALGLPSPINITDCLQGLGAGVTG